MTHSTMAAGSQSVLSRASVEALSRLCSEPDWLWEARLVAWERYEALQMPTTRDPGWRRTDLGGLDLERLTAGAPARADSQTDLSRAVDETSSRAGLLVLRDGRIEQRTLDEKLASRGVLLMSLSEAVQQKPELVRPYLENTADRPQQSKLSWLARALWSEGVFVYLPRGVTVDEPFQIVQWVGQTGPAFYHTLVVADEAASATVIDSYASPEDLPESLASGLVDVVAKQAARISYLHLQERDERCWSFTNMVAAQDRDSAVNLLTLELGARLSRNELTCSLRGQGAEADLIGMVFGEGSQYFDLQSVQDHVGSDTRSDLLHKVALRDRSRSNFTGLIRVGAEALRTASNQVSRNLLLDDGARADSDPNLEILNSDVTRCGHGAAVGPVDEEMIYYLMTRGLTQEQAERLIVEGFFAPLLEQIPLESVRERLRAAIYRKLER